MMAEKYKGGVKTGLNTVLQIRGTQDCFHWGLLDAFKGDLFWF